MLDKFSNSDYTYDAIVIGVGHAGIEAGLALARTGCRVIMFSISLDNVGYLACNPSIGGTAKGHLVREIDALGGEMGKCADSTLTQLKMLNSSHGPAVQSLRAQVDKYKYHEYMKSVLENTPNLSLRQAEIKELLIEDNFEGNTRKIKGIKTVLNIEYYAKTIVIACGVYLKSNIIIGDVIEPRGPVCFGRSNYLSESLEALGVQLRRFKTGTPARVKKSSIDLTKLEAQNGEENLYSFSDLSGKIKADKSPCYLGYTNLDTHRIIKDSIHLSPKYSGLIHGVGARYCPSIEDKIVRFADKPRHQFFLEPEGASTLEMYVQGLSTSLPADVQLDIYRSIEGFESVEIMRDAYAIEYDCIDPMQLYPTLMCKKIEGLFFAGQINGTSGYEEAAAQGIVAGINASLFIQGKEPLVLKRDNSYIGVLIDDLVTVGTNEPYRMMTSRAEYRLQLRQDNADLRLTPIGYKVGLASGNRYNKYLKKVKDMEKARALLAVNFSPKQLNTMFAEAREVLPQNGMTLSSVIKRNNITMKLFNKYFDIFKKLSVAAVYQIFIEVKYEGYLLRQQRTMKEAERVNNTALPADFDYGKIKGLRIEAREKLNQVKPLTLGQASRISGVTPADINVLIINLSKQSDGTDIKT